MRPTPAMILLLSGLSTSAKPQPAKVLNISLKLTQNLSLWYAAALADSETWLQGLQRLLVLTRNAGDRHDALLRCRLGCYVADCV